MVLCSTCVRLNRSFDLIKACVYVDSIPLVWCLLQKLYIPFMRVKCETIQIWKRANCSESFSILFPNILLWSLRTLSTSWLSNWTVAHNTLHTCEVKIGHSLLGALGENYIVMFSLQVTFFPQKYMYWTVLALKTKTNISYAYRKENHAWTIGYHNYRL